MEKNFQKNQNFDLEVQAEEKSEAIIHGHLSEAELNSLTEKVKLILILLYEVNKMSDLHKKQDVQ